MDITGKVLEVFPVQQVSDRFRKREVVLEYATNPQYPEFIKFEFVQDRTDLLDNFQPGQEVQVWFDLKGRKWTDRNGEIRYFTTLQGWRIQLASGAPDGAPGGAPAAQMSDIPPPPEFGGGQVDEIPF